MYSIIGDVRGKGLMIGVELVKPGTIEAIPVNHFAEFFDDCLAMGVMLGKGGIKGNVSRVLFIDY